MGAVARAADTVRSSALAATRRHRDRVADDSVYARSISTAVAELVATMVPRPTLATTLAVALSGLLSHDHPDTPRRPSPRPRDDYTPYSPYGEQLPPTTPGSLWDRLT